MENLIEICDVSLYKMDINGGSRLDYRTIGAKRLVAALANTKPCPKWFDWHPAKRFLSINSLTELHTVNKN